MKKEELSWKACRDRSLYNDDGNSAHFLIISSGEEHENIAKVANIVIRRHVRRNICSVDNNVLGVSVPLDSDNESKDNVRRLKQVISRISEHNW